MPNIGPLEIVVVLVIALIVLGPRRLPDFGRSVGRGLRELRSALSSDTPDRAAPDAEHEEHERDRRERELAEREERLRTRERELGTPPG